MARTSSAGLPHLTCRSDAGQFTYHRQFRPDLVPFLDGTLRLSWTRREIAIQHRLVVKVSLGTGDRRLAITRWEEMHPLVQTIVRDAERREAAARMAQRERIEPVALSSEHIRMMAGQVLHDSLADHDRTYCDPDHLNGTSQAIRAAQAQAGHEGPPDVAVIRAAERIARKSFYSDAIRERRLSLLNLTITEGEIHLTPESLEKLGGDPSHLTQLEREALARAPLIRPTTMPSELDVLLAANGLTLPLDHPSRAPLALAVARAQLQAVTLERSREGRRPEIETPTRPDPVMAPAADATEQPSPDHQLSSLLQRWKRDTRPTAKQADDKARYIRLFVSKFGDLAAETVTPVMVTEFRDALLQVPRNAPAWLREASLDALIAWTAKPENARLQRLSRTTINAKALGALSVVMDSAKRMGFVQTNPCSGQALDIKRGEVGRRKAYSDADLRLIFACGAFAPTPSITKGGRGPAAFWLPLLGLFMGARLEELGQLLVSDVRKTDEIHYVVVTDLPDEEEDEPTSLGKSVKTAAGRRRIPIHPELERLGFLSFVSRRRAAGYTRVFPELDYYRGRCTKRWSRYWGRHTDKYVTSSKDKVFHSFRHTFMRILRNRGVEEATIKALVGHASGSDVTAGYGGDDEGFTYDLATLNRAVNTIVIADLDLSHLVGRSQALSW